MREDHHEHVYKENYPYWTELYEISPELGIIGVKFDPYSLLEQITRLSFLLGSRDKPEIISEIGFPQFYIYPMAQ